MFLIIFYLVLFNRCSYYAHEATVDFLWFVGGVVSKVIFMSSPTRIKVQGTLRLSLDCEEMEKQIHTQNGRFFVCKMCEISSQYFQVIPLSIIYSKLFFTCFIYFSSVFVDITEQDRKYLPGMKEENTL